MRADGAILIDNKQVADTHQCCHCGGHFEMVKGSGTRRGFCMKCMAVTYGGPNCHNCRPFELQLERMEREASRGT